MYCRYFSFSRGGRVWSPSRRSIMNPHKLKTECTAYMPLFKKQLPVKSRKSYQLNVHGILLHTICRYVVGWKLLAIPLILSSSLKVIIYSLYSLKRLGKGKKSDFYHSGWEGSIITFYFFFVPNVLKIISRHYA